MNLPYPSPIVSELWISCTKPNAEAQVRLFCFPYAGAGSTIFNTWSDSLLPEVELYLIHLPGRDKRFKETPYKLLSPLAEALTEALYPHVNKPFAFFGHSMGALVGFEVARQIRSCFALCPVHLIVSGKRSPHLPDPHPNLHYLLDDELLIESEKLYGNLPEIITQDRELLQFFLAIMRADLTMIETYQYKNGDPLECPITVFGGTQDNSVDENELSAWRDHTVAAFNVQMFQGDHFFIQTNRTAIIQSIKKELFRYW